MKDFRRFFIKKLILSAITLIALKQSHAQYYYRDIVLPDQNAKQQQLYKKVKVAEIKLLGYEADGSPSEDFTCEVIPNSSYTQIRTVTHAEATGSASITAFYNFKGQLYKSVDSTNETVTTYNYSYDSVGRLVNAVSSAYTPADKRKQAETHIWSYTEQGLPAAMLYIKDGSDTTTVKFVTDGRGNVIEEEQWWRNTSKGKTYYYYDSSSRLTDIVRYNERLKKLMPDYLFEYNETGALSKAINVQPGNNDYITWLYDYNEKGLRNRERCYNKQKRLVGRIEYEYTFK